MGKKQAIFTRITQLKIREFRCFKLVKDKYINMHEYRYTSFTNTILLKPEGG